MHVLIGSPDKSLTDESPDESFAESPDRFLDESPNAIIARKQDTNITSRISRNKNK